MNRQQRILIIDDDVYASEMYAFALEKAGYRVDIADNGKTGEKRLGDGDYDVVLLDILLPQTNGDQILKRWRELNPLGSRPPIIILTNAEQDQINKANTKSEADLYLVKTSTTPRTLLKVIADLLNN